MTVKNFLVFIFLSVAIFATGMMLSYKKQGQVRSSEVVHPKMFPSLLDRLNEIHKVIIQHAEGSWEIVQEGPRWTLTQRQGYPVPHHTVRALAIGLAQLQKLEEKTAKPARYAALQVEDVTAGAKSRHVTLLDEHGTVMATLLLGKQVSTLGGTGTRAQGMYVREPGDPQSWLVRGGLTVGTQVRDWLDTQILTIPMARMARIRVQHGTGESVVVSRPNKETKQWTVEGIPEGRQLKHDAVADPLARSLAGLTLEDVARLSEPSAITDPSNQTHFTLFNGTQITLQQVKKGSEAWIRISTSVDATRDKTPSTDQETAGAAAEKEAKTLNDRLNGWLFRISPQTAKTLTPRMEAFLKPIEKTPDPVTAPPPPPADTRDTGSGTRDTLP